MRQQRELQENYAAAYCLCVVNKLAFKRTAPCPSLRDTNTFNSVNRKYTWNTAIAKKTLDENSASHTNHKLHEPFDVLTRVQLDCIHSPMLLIFGLN
jgi:hypothetical protein